MRLDRFLSEMGISSRSELKKEIRRGQVLLNGEEARDPSLFVDPENPPVVLYRGREFHYEAFSYYMMNKPAGILSASRDKKQSTVLDLIQEDRRRDLFPVGVWTRTARAFSLSVTTAPSPTGSSARKAMCLSSISSA